MEAPSDLLATIVAVAVLATIAVLVLSLFRVPARWAPVTALARAAAQLAVLSVILAGIITHPLWIATALLVMFVAASLVAARRTGRTRRAIPMMVCSIAAGALVSCTVVFATGALELSPRYALALGAIVIGNAMSVATLTSRHLRGLTYDHWEEVEGWLALGATARRSTLDLARRAVHEALIPSTDQARTTGLVVLPGAFVGAIFGGLSPVEAGRFQLIVLACILAAGPITAVLIAVWQGAVRTKPEAPER